MSKETRSSDDMYDTLGRAFSHTQKLNEALDIPTLERGQKISLRNEAKKLREMLDGVLKYKNDVTEDVIIGMNEVLELTEAKLDGREIPEMEASNELAA